MGVANVCGNGLDKHRRLYLSRVCVTAEPYLYHSEAIFVTATEPYLYYSGAIFITAAEPDLYYSFV